MRNFTVESCHSSLACLPLHEIGNANIFLQPSSRHFKKYIKVKKNKKCRGENKKEEKMKFSGKDFTRLDHFQVDLSDVIQKIKADSEKI